MPNTTDAEGSHVCLAEQYTLYNNMEKKKKIVHTTSPEYLLFCVP